LNVKELPTWDFFTVHVYYAFYLTVMRSIPIAHNAALPDNANRYTECAKLREPPHTSSRRRPGSSNKLNRLDSGFHRNGDIRLVQSFLSD